MIKLHNFNEAGLDAVRIELNTLTGNLKKGSHGVPVNESEIDKCISLSNDPNLVEEAILQIEVDENKVFKSSFELGNYLFTQFSGADVRSLDVGVWTWLSLLYLKQLLKKGKSSGTYIMGSSYRYVFEDKQRLRYYRHLVYMPYYLVQKLNSDSYIFLHSPVYESGEFLAQAQKDVVVSNKNIISMCQYYYFDSKKKKYAPGFTGKVKDPRSLRKLVQIIVPQLMVNYDVRVCEPEAIYQLLPDDFKSNAFEIRDGE